VASEENPAERKQSEGLPEGNEPPSEQRWQQPIPEIHHHFTAKDDESYDPQDREWSYPNQFPSHSVPHFPVNSS
jgi:hypothetical protein